HYISKPFNPEQFVENISKIVSAETKNKAKNNTKSETSSEKEADSQRRDQNSREVGDNVIVLDREEGLKYMGNNQSLYESVLKAYLGENQEVIENLELAIKARHYQEAAQVIHKVKSSSGSIGAKQVFEIAKDFQKALENGVEEEIVNYQPKFIAAMRQLLDTINKI
ncbi:MAG: Hpt domain-containing protein, partial [Acetobacterium sp.]|nr:Hpt domain-containing protein [Acetobacterium sp.]